MLLFVTGRPYLSARCASGRGIAEYWDSEGIGQNRKPAGSLPAIRGTGPNASQGVLPALVFVVFLLGGGADFLSFVGFSLDFGCSFGFVPVGFLGAEAGSSRAR